MTPSEHLTVETPENIRFGYDVADIGSRFLAILIDSLIQSAIYIVLFLVVALIGSRATALNLPARVADLLGIVFLFVLFIIQFGYFMFFEIITGGQTPGKRLFGLRVIKDNGYPLSPLDSIIRNLIRIIDFFPFAYGIGVITMFANRRAKRLGDFAAGTLVVKLRDNVQLVDLRLPSTPTAPPPVLGMEGLGLLDESDVMLAESFLQRRTQLSTEAELSTQIASRLREKMNLPESNATETPNGAVAFLQKIVEQYRARHA